MSKRRTSIGFDPLAWMKEDAGQENARPVVNESVVAGSALDVAFDCAAVPLVLVDIDLVVTHVNRATTALFSAHRSALASVAPDFDPGAPLGGKLNALYDPEAADEQLFEANQMRLRVRAGKLADSAGNVSGYCLALEDLTHERLVQGRLETLLDTAASEIGVLAEGWAARQSQVLAAAAGITEFRSRFDEILRVTQDIAFQTKLLALNTALEASRAGEAGAGFADLAGEVRAFSVKSAAAVDEIKALMQDNAENLDDGLRLVRDSMRPLAVLGDAARSFNAVLQNKASGETETGASGVLSGLAEALEALLAEVRKAKR